jgi:hypothetical protein
VLAAGAITLFNQSIINGQGVNFRIPVGAGIAAGGLFLLEKVSEDMAVGFAWLILVGVLFVRMNPGEPSPIENFNNWYNAK